MHTLRKHFGAEAPQSTLLFCTVYSAYARETRCRHAIQAVRNDHHTIIFQITLHHHMPSYLHYYQVMYR